MAHQQHNSTHEFDTMLRRHLKQGGAPVAPCAGFDADTASAYVERALATGAQQRFETHLAGCAACRRHVVALSRLSDELVPLPAAAAAPKKITEPLWTRWHAAVTQWFDFSAWNLGWTAAGATACALFFTVLGVRVWQQRQAPQAAASLSASVAGYRAEDAPAPQASPLVIFDGTAGVEVRQLMREAAKSQQPETEISTGVLSHPQVSQVIGNAERARQIPPPATPLPAIPMTSSLAATTSAPEMRVLARDAGDAGVTTPPMPPPSFNLSASTISFSQPATSLNGGGLNGGAMMPVRLSGDTPMRASSQLISLPGEPERKELVAELVLPEPRRARLREEEASKKTATEAAKTASSRELLKTLKGRTFGFMPTKPVDKDAEARTKEADVKEAQSQTKPLMKRLNGHVFFFDHGFWIDEQYTSDAKLPLKRLARGSQEYQQTLIQNPSLEQFFQLGPVIVVWKGVVYEVRK